MKNQTYVLYHGQCPDGFGAAFAAWLRFGDDATYIPVFYGKPPPEMEPGSTVFILDFSYPAQTLLDMAQTMIVKVLDHHASAQKDLSAEAFLTLLGSKAITDALNGPDGWLMIRNLWVKFDMNKSGAVLAWEYFHPNITVPEFFLYLQDRDLWTFSIPKSREVSMALRSYPMDFRGWQTITNITAEKEGMTEGDKAWEQITGEQILTHRRNALDRLKTEGVACRRLTEQQVEIMAKNHRWAEFAMPPYTTTAHIRFNSERRSTGYGVNNMPMLISAPVANATVFFSEVGEKLLEMFPEAPFAAYYLDRSDGLRQWGLRSRKDFDCATLIAKPFGGGGHPQAAGFTQKL